MKSLYALLITLAIQAAPAWAQNQTLDLSTQVRETSDYVSTLITRFSSAGTSRFALSSDYSRVGPQLQQRFSQALTEFRSSMDVLGQGAFPAAIERYNRAVNDKNRSDRDSMIQSEGKTLQILARAFQSTYHASLIGLLSIQPAWLLNEFQQVDRSGTDRTYCSWFDGSTSKKKQEDLEIEYCYQVGADRIRNSIFSACKTQTCVASLVSDYAGYYSDVMNSINRTITVTLADGNKIQINGLQPHDVRAKIIIDGLTGFDFNLDFQNLPQKN